VPKRVKWGVGAEISFVGRRFRRWQCKGSQPSNVLEGKPGTAGIT
jgi:hypothetical protein